MSDQWVPVTNHSLPNKGQKVIWLDPTGNEVGGSYEGVWLMDNGMYVYYQPSYWRPSQ